MKKDMENAILGGVCAGMGGHMNIPAVWIRLAFFLSVLFSWGTTTLVYIFLWVIMPEDNN